ncbi:hypothetical protein COT72_00050 [archaeon CG10_big_fil_rev_8_21_14_0_10_43_11]|nr:MAG: hypothetical protein COT72_00050 [archaeon CG10_big_fil_rev_8_21_14_0_10_43_11]
MVYKLDMHVHSRYSDGTNSVKELIRATKHQGIDGFALTDHDTLKGLAHVKNTRALVIPGCEISTQGGHVLAYGIQECVPKDLPVEEALERVHEQGALAVCAHPFDFLFKGVSNFKAYAFDGVEVLNALNLDSYSNTRAQKRAHNMIHTGGSDAHLYQSMGFAYTLFESLDSVDDVLVQLKKKQNRVGGRVLRAKEYIALSKQIQSSNDRIKHCVLTRLAQPIINTLPLQAGVLIARGVIPFIRATSYARELVSYLRA